MYIYIYREREGEGEETSSSAYEIGTGFSLIHEGKMENA
jgi:hypothetical protein